MKYNSNIGVKLTPFFSIIITTYNRASFIDKAIQSIVEQTYINWELIIIDDGSTDSTDVQVRKYLKDNRIKYYWKKNEERCVARNYGANIAIGDFLLFLDSDDYFLPTHLENIFNAIESNTYRNAIYYTNIITKILKDNTELKKDQIVNVSDKHAINITNFGVVSAPPILSMAVPRKIFNNIKYSDKWLPFNEHYHFTLELLMSGLKIVHVNKRTAVVILHNHNSTNCDSDPVSFSMERFKYMHWAINNDKLNITREFYDHYISKIYDIILRKKQFVEYFKYIIILLRFSLTPLMSRRFYSVMLYKLKR